MHITFLCSSLEPGRDGVGDYTRRIAMECAKAGHGCSLIALSDGHLAEPAGEQIGVGRENIAVLRLPSAQPWPRRIEAATAFCNGSRPDWISFQFVPYGYHPKGFVEGLERRLQPIFERRRVHMMFHELWLGGYTRAPWKERIVGAVQRAAILRLIRRVDPAAVTTSNPAYCGMLQRHGAQVNVLRLFGNIPIAERPEVVWFEEELRRSGVSGEGGARDRYWVFALFGTLHRGWPPEPLFSLLLKAAQSQEKRIVVASIGRLGPGEALWDELAARYKQTIHFIKLGEQPSERISALLQFADYGIASSPWELVGKSGSAASMLEHGLPVIVNRDEVHFAGFENGTPQPGLVKMDRSLPVSLLSLKRRSPNPAIAAVARELISRLSPPLAL